MINFIKYCFKRENPPIINRNHQIMSRLSVISAIVTLTVLTSVAAYAGQLNF